MPNAKVSLLCACAAGALGLPTTASAQIDPGVNTTRAARRARSTRFRSWRGAPTRPARQTSERARTSRSGWASSRRGGRAAARDGATAAALAANGAGQADQANSRSATRRVLPRSWRPASRAPRQPPGTAAPQRFCSRSPSWCPRRCLALLLWQRGATQPDRKNCLTRRATGLPVVCPPPLAARKWGSAAGRRRLTVVVAVAVAVAGLLGAGGNHAEDATARARGDLDRARRSPRAGSAPNATPRRCRQPVRKAGTRR